MSNLSEHRKLAQDIDHLPCVHYEGRVTRDGEGWLSSATEVYLVLRHFTLLVYASQLQVPERPTFCFILTGDTTITVEDSRVNLQTEVKGATKSFDFNCPSEASLKAWRSQLGDAVEHAKESLFLNAAEAKGWLKTVHSHVHAKAAEIKGLKEDQAHAVTDWEACEELMNVRETLLAAQHGGAGSFPEEPEQEASAEDDSVLVSDEVEKPRTVMKWVAVLGVTTGLLGALTFAAARQAHPEWVAAQQRIALDMANHHAGKAAGTGREFSANATQATRVLLARARHLANGGLSRGAAWWSEIRGSGSAAPS